jgi:transposase
VESGSSRREAAEEFDVSASSAIKWVAAYRTTGSCAAKPRGGSTSPPEKYANFLLILIEGQPDLTLDEAVCAMRKSGSALKIRVVEPGLQPGFFVSRVAG